MGSQLRPPRRPSPHSSRRAFSLQLILVPAFLCVYFLAWMFWAVPEKVGLAYLALSAITLTLYAMDKAAARADRRRISENTLHLFSLVGGWPGALIGQQWLRHKTVKAEFRFVFWITVVINVAAFVLVYTPAGHALLAWWQTT